MLVLADASARIYIPGFDMSFRFLLFFAVRSCLTILRLCPP